MVFFVLKGKHWAFKTEAVKSDLKLFTLHIT